MEREFVTIKNQKFEIGRTINPFNCTCEECTFLNCPKKNYAVKMKIKTLSFDKFWECHGKTILSLNPILPIDYNFQNRFKLKLSYNLICEMMECITFPKGTFWAPGDITYESRFSNCEYEDTQYSNIHLVKFSRSGKEITIGSVGIEKEIISDFGMSNAQTKLSNSISSFVQKIDKAIFAYYEDLYKDHLIGWLSPEGRHYICKITEHDKLAHYLGRSEFSLENTGWIKLPSNDTDMGWLCRPYPSAEQRNFLSEHGYDLEFDVFL